MQYGLLSGLNDPDLMARVAERQRIAERIAEQTGCTVREARWTLEAFEDCLCHCDDTLH
jgi:hypothetical protein